jgi:hypothetical protein
MSLGLSQASFSCEYLSFENLVFYSLFVKCEIMIEEYPLLGDIGPFFEARSWEEVGRWLPTSDLYKPGLLEAMGQLEKVQNKFILPDY